MVFGCIYESRWFLHAITQKQRYELTLAELANLVLYVRGSALCRHLQAGPNARERWGGFREGVLLMTVDCILLLWE